MSELRHQDAGRNDQYPVCEWSGDTHVKVREGREVELILARVCWELGAAYLDWRFVHDEGRRSGNIQILMQPADELPKWVPVYAMHRIENLWTVYLTDTKTEESK